MKIAHTLPTPRELRQRAVELELRPTKTLGQNFVHDANTIARIVRLAQLTSDDVVLEVGPGLGSLTIELLSVVKKVFAVEIDPRLAEALPRTIQQYIPQRANNLQVICADAVTLTGLARLPGEPVENGAPTALVANLPYNTAVPILLNALERFPTIAHGLIMVQTEVAERLVAEPGSKAYGIPSVKLTWYAHSHIAGHVPRTVFWPVPRVDSSLVAFTRHAPPTTAPNTTRQEVFALVDAAFAQRRKTLRGALSQHFGSPARAEVALTSAGIDPRARGETLTVEEFALLAQFTQL